MKRRLALLICAATLVVFGVHALFITPAPQPSLDSGEIVYLEGILDVPSPSMQSIDRSEWSAEVTTTDGATFHLFGSAIECQAPTGESILIEPSQEGSKYILTSKDYKCTTVSRP